MGDATRANESAWLIGGLRFVPSAGDASSSRIGDDYETIALDHGDEARSIHVTGNATAVQERVSHLLLAAGRLPLHAALVTRRTESPGVLILGASGQGKSSLAWLAVSMGWRIVSDDLVALREIETGAVVGATFRKRLRIPGHLVDRQTRALGRRMKNQVGLLKVHLDPDVLRPGSFVREARIGRVAFLERSESRCLRRASRLEALERLIAICSPALAVSQSKRPFQILCDLVRRADARIARLTQSCLSDPDVLEELAA